MKKGYQLNVEKGAGILSNISDDEYRESGANLCDTRDELYANSDVIVKVNPPDSDEIKLLSDKKTVISFMYPGRDPQLMDEIKQTGTTSFAMDCVPRITRFIYIHFLICTVYICVCIL